MRIAVIGATGQLGRRLTARLLAAGHEVIGVGRSLEKVRTLSIPGRVADCFNIPALRAALSDARLIVSCAYAGTAPYVVKALPDGIERVVLTGSTRRYSRFPDTLTKQLIDAETHATATGVPCVFVYPTMIMGEDGKFNVQRIAAYIRRFGIVPLPGGGRSLVQPIYTLDVARCLEAALTSSQAVGTPIVAAGRDAIAYSDLVKATAAAIGKSVQIVNVPAPLMMSAAPLTRIFPGIPSIGIPEVRRLLEDKNFPINDMRLRLGVEPIGFAEILARTFNGGVQSQDLQTRIENTIGTR